MNEGESAAVGWSIPESTCQCITPEHDFSCRWSESRAAARRAIATGVLERIVASSDGPTEQRSNVYIAVGYANMLLATLDEPEPAKEKATP